MRDEEIKKILKDLHKLNDRIDNMISYETLKWYFENELNELEKKKKMKMREDR